MARHDDSVAFQQMIDHAKEATAMADGKNRTDLAAERMLELALIRLVEIVGEAAARVSPEGRQRIPSIPWREVIDMRNRLIHGYDSVDLDVLWHTIEIDLPFLIVELEKYKKIII